MVVASAAAAGAALAAPPEIVHLGLVAPDVVGITVQAGKAVHGRQIEYRKAEGDYLPKEGDGRWIMRYGKWYGRLIGKDKKLVYTVARLEGEPLDEKRADDPASYSLSSRNDRAYREGVAPVEVHRKSKPTDYAQVGPWDFEAPRRHVIYLKLPKPLKPGKTYRLEFAGGLLPDREFKCAPEETRSEAVHASHIGFRPDDPAKVAFLSCWLGDGGPLAYPEGLRFSLIEETTGKARFQGRARLVKPGADKDEDEYKRNYSGVDVHEMDFSEFSRPGRYRVCVEGIGCSYPFGIGPDVWREPVRTSARGYYHQRSGVELGPPYTEYRRPRCFHPDDGVEIYHSTAQLMDTGNGLNARGEDKGNFEVLVKGRTDKVVPGLWGGLMDAGDWDRRIQHLVVTRLMIDLAELFPDYFGNLDLNIPESGRKFPDSGDRVPDIVSEGLFNLEFYRRCQEPDGGVRGGVESEEHPRHGEASWQESLAVMAYAPGVWSSCLFAATAARMARYLEPHDRVAAAGWKKDSLRAMDWAEKNLPARPKEDPHGVNDARNLAAACLFQLTGEARWHELFLATTAFKDPGVDLYVWRKHEQREAAWTYLRTDPGRTDPAVRNNCLAALRKEADDRLACVNRTGFRWAKDGWRPVMWGAINAGEAVSLFRAHALTGEEKYLKGAVLACGHGLGANPMNTCYTTGLGAEAPLHPLHIDSRITNQPAPPGLTVFGPADTEKRKDEWDQKLASRFCHPPAEEWPTLEAFWDVFWYPSMCEYTPQEPMAHTTFAWGYLAAR